MQVSCALLCDAATVREGLLHVLGGGITRLHRSQYPAPMNAALALQILVHPTEARSGHQVSVLVQHEDGQAIAEASIGFELDEDDELAAGELYTVPLVVPMTPVGLPTAGGYSIEVLIDGTHHASIPFRALLSATET